MNWQERAEKAEAELAKAMEQRDGLAAKLAELCEQKPVVKYMSRRLTPVGTKEMWGYDLVDGLSDGIMLYAGPVQIPVVADCRTCKNRGRTNGLSQESFCESCVWQLMSFRKNHYAPNSPDFEEIKMVELPKNDAAPVPAVAAPAVPEEWREVMAELADDLAIEIDQSYPPERRAYPSEQRKYEGEMAPVYRARTLLQSATQSGSDPVAHHPV